MRSEEHTSELQSQSNLVCRLLLEKKKARPGVCRVNAGAQPPPLRAGACGRRNAVSNWRTSLQSTRLSQAIRPTVGRVRRAEGASRYRQYPVARLRHFLTRGGGTHPDRDTRPRTPARFDAVLPADLFFF